MASVHLLFGPTGAGKTIYGRRRDFRVGGVVHEPLADDELRGATIIRD